MYCADVIVCCTAAAVNWKRDLLLKCLFSISFQLWRWTISQLFWDEFFFTYSSDHPVQLWPNFFFCNVWLLEHLNSFSLHIVQLPLLVFVGNVLSIIFSAACAHSTQYVALDASLSAYENPSLPTDIIWTVMIVVREQIIRSVYVVLYMTFYKVMRHQWRIQNFIMTVEVPNEVGRGCAPPQKKIEFLAETGGFRCILGLLFTFKKAQEKAYKTNWSGQWGAAPTLESATVRHIYVQLLQMTIACCTEFRFYIFSEVESRPVSTL